VMTMPSVEHSLAGGGVDESPSRRLNGLSSRRIATMSTLGRRFPAQVLTPAEVTALLGACPETPVGARNRALITVLYRAGLRVSEALSLLVDDVRLDLPAITVREGKGRRSRIVGIDRDACGSIENWLREREALSPPAAAPLFCTMSGGGVQASY